MPDLSLNLAVEARLRMPLDVASGGVRINSSYQRTGVICPRRHVDSSKGETPAMWPRPVIVPGSSKKRIQEELGVANADRGSGDQAPARDYEALARLLSAERLGSYLRWSGGDVPAAFALYEWNMAASAAVMHTTGMVEVVVRNAMDRALVEMGDARGWQTWFDRAPLDQRGRIDIQKARDRATRFGSQPEIHGKVVAELSLGFWRYLAASRYLTALWTPALYAAFPAGPGDKLEAQRQVDRCLKNLLLVRNRAAHHEPIHRRNLVQDLRASVEVASWVSSEAGEWVADLSTIAEVVADRPVAGAP